MRYKIFITIVLFSFIACATAFAQMKTVPWDKIKDGEGLSDKNREMAEEVLRTTDSYAGCSDTILTCLLDEPENRAVLRIANFVARRAKLGKGVEDIKQDLEKRAASVYPPKIRKIDVTGLKPSGDPNSKVRVVIYADFECPYCNVAAPALRKLSIEQPKLLAYYYKNFPVKSHKHGISSAIMLLAADKQGKFYEMHDALYEATDLADEKMRAIAQKLGLDMAKLDKDLKDPSIIDRIRKEKEEGLAFGMIGTPGIFINGKFYKGVKTYEELKDRLEEEQDIVAGLQ